MPGAELLYLDTAYPDFKIDTDKERQRVRNVDIIVLQYPIYWYTPPAIMKRWQEEVFAFGQRGARVFRKIEDLPFPVIAAVNGFALGGGCELAMACDIRVASAKARFGQPEVGLGIIPGFSGTYRLPKLVGQGIAKDLRYTGKMIGADEALRIGLVNSVVAPEELDAAVNALVSAILKNAPVAVGFAKSCINENYDLDIDESITLENRYFAKCFATSDQKEGMDAFLNKRPAQFKNE